MNSVFYLSRPVENVPYEYYLAFKPAAERRPQLENSIAFRTHEATRDSMELLSAGQLGLGGGLASLASQVIQEEQAIRGEAEFGLDQDGIFSNFTGLAIPLCLGDYFGDYRVVGTTPALFDDLVYDFERDLKYGFAEGRNFREFTPEHGYFECVVGSIVAARKGVKIGDKINPTHGAPDAHAHEQEFTVVGILKPSGTPNDRAVFVNMEGFFLINDHAKPVDAESEEDSGEDEWQEFLYQPSPAGRPGSEEDDGGQPDTQWVSFTPTQSAPSQPPAKVEPSGNPDWSAFEPLPIEQREVTSILVLADDALTGGDMAAMHIVNKVNDGVLEGTLDWSNYRPTLAQKSAQGVQPISEIERLFQAVIGPIRYLLLALTIMICVVSGISILVSIYNSMSERRHEIAVMRAWR